MNQKYFTVEEANNTLVLVNPIVKDIILKRKKMISLKKAIRDMRMSDKKKYYTLKIQESTDLLKNISREITYHLEELEMVGCYLKDFETGIIDFPSIMKGRVVFLCWMYGEPKVQNWHELTLGFEGRQEISTEFTTLKVTPIRKYQSNE